MSTGVVLGLGGTVDYEIAWDGSVLEALVEQYGITAGELTAAVPVETERDLVRSILGFVRDGSGGERFVASSQILETFAARFPRRITLGGTCVRAALSMERLGRASTVHLVSIDDHVRRLLPERISYVCSADADSTDPHLIVQFPQGATVRTGDIDLRAAHANRLIYVNDPPNRELVLSPELGELFASARVVLVSGFNTVQDEAILADRLAELGRHLDRLPEDAVVVFEDAGYHVPAMVRLVGSALVHRVDAWSMNEDEMQAYVGRRVELLDPDDLVDALTALREAVPATVLIVHTKYWALALGPEATAWREPVRGGVTMASARYLHGDDVTVADYDAVRDEPGSAVGRSLAEAVEHRLGVQVAVVPGHVLSAPHPTTIGLGDSFIGGVLAVLAGTTHDIEEMHP